MRKSDAQNLGGVRVIQVMHKIWGGVSFCDNVRASFTVHRCFPEGTSSYPNTGDQQQSKLAMFIYERTCESLFGLFSLP